MISISLLMLLPAIQVGIAVAAVVFSSYWIGSCMLSRFTRKSCS